jgi:integrase
MYGSGLRLNECISLRVHDIDFGYKQIIVRNAKGEKERTTVLPDRLVDVIHQQIEHVQLIHKNDLEDGYGSVYLPYALRRKYKNAEKEFNYDISTIQELLGHEDVSTTMIYTHVLQSGAKAVLSPVDKMFG